jgi:hypothetical protein
MSTIVGMHNVPLQPGFLQQSAQAVAQSPTAAITAVAAASASLSVLLDPSNGTPILIGDALDANKWADCFLGNYFALTIIDRLLHDYFGVILSGPLSTQHLIWLSLSQQLTVAARYPHVARDRNFCEGANLLLRELYIDLAAKSGTPASGLQTMRETARLDKLPDTMVSMNKAAADRAKMKKGD